MFEDIIFQEQSNEITKSIQIDGQTINLIPGSIESIVWEHLMNLKRTNNQRIKDKQKNTLDELEKKLIDGTLKANIALEQILDNLRQDYEPNSEEYTSSSLSKQNKNILDLAIEKGGNLNQVFDDFSDATVTSSTSNGSYFSRVIPENILIFFIKEYSLKPNLILKYAIKNKLPDLLDYILDSTPNLEVKLDNYLEYFYKSNFNFSIKLVKALPNIFDKEKAYEFFKSLGASELDCHKFLDYHELVENYIQTKNGHKNSLSNSEVQILDADYEINDVQSYKDMNLTNNYGFTSLQLVMIANRYDIALKLLELGADIYAQNNNKLTSFHLLPKANPTSIKENNFLQEFYNYINDVDIDLGNGASLTDTLIKNKNLEHTVLEKSNDSLYSLFKEDADLFIPSQNTSKTNIAISHGDGFWSSGIWSTSRLITNEHPDVTFYLVKDEMIKRGGENFIKQFDAVINPGAADSFPKELEEFSKEDLEFSMNLEQHYQNMLNLTNEFNIPYLGMCAGFHHLILYGEGKLKPLSGYNKGQHNITFLKGTLPHFLSLNSDQQEKALKCQFSDVSFKGDTAHNYAAVLESLGKGGQLGAVSEDNIPMAYMHSNIRYATQYHPEHHYNAETSNINHKKLWLDNFINIAQMHHDHRINNASHPIEYFSHIEEILSGCMLEQEDTL